MQIYGPVHVHGAQPIHAPHAAEGVSSQGISEGISIPRDEVHISDTASFVDQAKNLPDIRTELVGDIKAALIEGTYDIDGRLDTAVDRLLDEIA